MLVLAWVAGLALATRYFGVWEDRQRNPNQGRNRSMATATSSCAWPAAARAITC